MSDGGEGDESTEDEDDQALTAADHQGELDRVAVRIARLRKLFPSNGRQGMVPLHLVRRIEAIVDSHVTYRPSLSCCAQLTKLEGGMSHSQFDTGKPHQQKVSNWVRRRLADSNGCIFEFPNRHYQEEVDQYGVILADAVGLGKTWDRLRRPRSCCTNRPRRGGRRETAESTTEARQGIGALSAWARLGNGWTNFAARLSAVP